MRTADFEEAEQQMVAYIVQPVRRLSFHYDKIVMKMKSFRIARKG